MRVAEYINGKMAYRDATPEEIAERERMEREMEEAEANREPTVEEQLSDLFDLVSVLTEVICDD